MNPRDFLASPARVYPDKIAYIDGPRRRTWAEIDERSSRLAAGLQSLGVGKGDTVAILAHDHVESSLAAELDGLVAEGRQNRRVPVAFYCQHS